VLRSSNASRDLTIVDSAYEIIVNKQNSCLSGVEWTIGWLLDGKKMRIGNVRFETPGNNSFNDFLSIRKVGDGSVGTCIIWIVMLAS